MEKNIVYALSTCSHCKATKKMLSKCDVEYKSIDVDELFGEERQAILADIRELNPKCSFPTIKINDMVIVGYNEKKIRETLGMKKDKDIICPCEYRGLDLKKFGACFCCTSSAKPTQQVQCPVNAYNFLNLLLIQI